MALNTFILEVTDHKGNKRLHGCGVGGVPDVTAEMLADHLVKHNHFRGKAKKVKILHRSEIAKVAASGVTQLKKENLPPLTREMIEIHGDANNPFPDLKSDEAKKFTEQAAVTDDDQDVQVDVNPANKPPALLSPPLTVTSIPSTTPVVNAANPDPATTNTSKL
jgi:hypothetical protein